MGSRFPHASHGKLALRFWAKTRKPREYLHQDASLRQLAACQDAEWQLGRAWCRSDSCDLRGTMRQARPSILFLATSLTNCTMQMVTRPRGGLAPPLFISVGPSRLAEKHPQLQRVCAVRSTRVETR